MSTNMFRHDPSIGYRFIPNLRARVQHESGGYRVLCNAAGFRSHHDFDKPKPEGTKRVLVFGDSYTAGDGVDNDKRFSDIIEKGLNGVEVFNFGLPNSGTDQQYIAFDTAAGGLDHDLLLLCPMVDNIRRNLESERVIMSGMSGEKALLPKPYFQVEGDGLRLCNSPVPKGPLPLPENDGDEASSLDRGLRGAARTLMRKADAQIPGLRSLSQRVRRIALPHEYNDARDPGWLLMRAILSRWISESRAPVILCPIPTFGHVFGDIRSTPYRKRFGELASETGTVFVDLIPAFHAVPMEERRALRFVSDDHPTPRGHALIASALMPHVRRVLGVGQA